MLSYSPSVSPSVSQAPDFGNISQTPRPNFDNFYVQVLFRMRRGDTKFRFGLKTIRRG